MNLQTRVGRLEEATCANEVCFLCVWEGVMTRAFSDTLKRHGVDVEAIPLELEEVPCAECGAADFYNLHGVDEEMRDEWRALNASSSRDFAARATFSKDSERKFNELCERDRARCVRLYGAHYDAAHEASRAAMIAWLDEHEPEVRAAWNRPPLVQRRGLAA